MEYDTWREAWRHEPRNPYNQASGVAERLGEVCLDILVALPKDRDLWLPYIHLQLHFLWMLYSEYHFSVRLTPLLLAAERLRQCHPRRAVIGCLLSVCSEAYRLAVKLQRENDG
jgi:hypothetical protein